MKLPFRSSEENFVVIEVLPERTSALLLSLDSDQHLRLRHTWAEIPKSSIAGWLGTKKLPQNIIVAADSSLAYTATIPVKLVRKEVRGALTSHELQDLLAQAILRIFNQCRQEAGRALKMDDLDLVLANSRVVNFKIDGHKVLNPLGFDPHTIEAALELTLTTRAVFDQLKLLFRGEQNFFFTEVGRAELLSLARIEEMPINLFMLESDRAYAMTLVSRAVGKGIERERVNWAVQSLHQGIRAEWGLSVPAAAKIYDMFMSLELSEEQFKKISKIFESDLKKFVALLTTCRFKGNVYLDAPFRLPIELPLKKRGFTLLEPPLSLLLDRSGFTINPKEWPFRESRIFRHLSPFLEFYHDRSDSHINQWLRRRLNWLGSSV